MTVAELTPEQLKAFVKESVREALEELLSDPDDGLELKETLVKSLVDRGRNTEPNVKLSEVAKELGLSL
jgi:DNA invertase Pin-like site-specific DNA recombinase